MDPSFELDGLGRVFLRRPAAVLDRGEISAYIAMHSTVGLFMLLPTLHLATYVAAAESDELTTLSNITEIISNTAAKCGTPNARCSPKLTNIKKGDLLLFTIDSIFVDRLIQGECCAIENSLLASLLLHLWRLFGSV